MPASKANQRAVNKYKKNNYDRMEIVVPKGTRETIRAHAESRSESVNSFVKRAIDQAMAQEAIGASQETAMGILTPSALKAAQKAAEAAGEAVPQFMARAVETQAQRDAMSRRMKGKE